MSIPFQIPLIPLIISQFSNLLFIKCIALPQYPPELLSLIAHPNRELVLMGILQEWAGNIEHHVQNKKKVSGSTIEFESTPTNVTQDPHEESRRTLSINEYTEKYILAFEACLFRLSPQIKGFSSFFLL